MAILWESGNLVFSKKIKMKHILIGFVLLFFFVSCGKGKKSEKVQQKETKTVQKVKAPEEEQTIVVDADGVVNVSMRTDDRMKFNLKKINVKSGQTVRLTLTHAGKLDKRIMGHNVVFLNKGTKVSSFASKAAASRDNDFIPEGTTVVLAHTKMIGGGEVTSIEFTAPAVGSYDYICTFPAHYAMMKGKLIVE
jgi:azurin